jgi:hypothetical protein
MRLNSYYSNTLVSSQSINVLIQLIANRRSLKLIDSFDVGPVVEVSQAHVYNVLDGS